MCRKLKEGQRVVAVPWPSAEGEGTWQQYVAVPIENLVCCYCFEHCHCKQTPGKFNRVYFIIADIAMMHCQYSYAGASERRGVK